MKKVLLIMMLTCISMKTFAQDIYLDIESYPANQTLCYGNGQHVYVNAQPECQGFGWIIDGQSVVDVSPIIINPEIGNHTIEYFGCDEFYHFFRVIYKNAPVPNGWTKVMWKMPGTTIQLEAIELDSLDNYTPTWQVGPPNNHNVIYNASEPGTYPVEISSPCGTTIRTYIVYDMADLALASTDPVSSQIYLQWDTEESILQNASTIKFFCDDTTNMVGIADISNGVWVDTTTQSTGVRNYWCRTVANSGEESPLWGPIQTIFAKSVPTMDPQKAIALWNKPLGYEPFSWFRLNQIIINGKDSPEIIAIDSVASTETMIEFDISLVNENNKINIEAVYSEGKTTRRIAPSSNPIGAEEVVSISENIENDEPFDVYPNPAKGLFKVKAKGNITITTIHGQVVLVQNVDGEKNITLPKGEYVVTYNRKSRVIVVE